MSDLENELLGLAEDDPGHHSKKRGAAGSSRKSKSQALWVSSLIWPPTDPQRG